MRWMACLTALHAIRIRACGVIARLRAGRRWPVLLVLLAIGVFGEAQSLRVVATDVAGEPDGHPHMRYGGIFEYPANTPGLTGSDDRRVMFGYEMQFGYDGLDPAADYRALRCT